MDPTPTATPVIATDRLVLRGWRESDREPFAALNADPRVMEHFPKPLSSDESNALIERTKRAFREEGMGLWAVERREDEAFLGFTGLVAPTFVAAFTPCVEIGWRFAAAAWGNGYATEAARAVLEFGFDHLRLPEIVSFTAVGNGRSRRVMERIGMTHDPADDFDHPRLPEGDRLRRHVLYRVCAERWRAIQRAGPPPPPLSR